MQDNWDIEFTDEFERWWDTLGESAQEAVAHNVEVLGRFGPALGRPFVDQVRGSKHLHMKELRTQHRGASLRILFAFDPRRCAILLIGGDKSGDRRFYERLTKSADALYDEHLSALKDEGLL
jgi:hypothetical protein